MLFSSYAETVGALQGLLWLTPRYIVEGVLGSGNIEIVNAENGFTEIFRRMLDLENLEPEFDSEVLVCSYSKVYLCWHHDGLSELHVWVYF